MGKGPKECYDDEKGPKRHASSVVWGLSECFFNSFIVFCANLFSFHIQLHRNRYGRQMDE
jgi:hypothetical protein